MKEVFLDRYVVECEVGQGGMAVVYRGTDLVLNRPVAIKVLHQHLAQKPEARARFAREARIIARLKHPNVVEVYDFSGEDSDRAFIVAEFVEGMPLSDFLSRYGPMPPEVAALVTGVVARALHHAHEQGVIHRDVKPENIMVRRDGVLKLMDFGIAHVVDMEHLTMTGAIIGSPAHMSPEQVDGKALDARTDIFSLGTMFFLLSSGMYPFNAETASGLLKQIVEARVPDIRAIRPGFPEDLYRVLRKMMARSPADRHASASEVADALEAAVAELGLSRDQAELARYLTDPEGYAEELRPRLAAARLRRAQAFLRAGKPALAIRELDGVIANDPDNVEAKRALAKAKRSVRRRAYSRNAMFLAVGAGIILGVFMALLRPWDNSPSEVVFEPPAPASFIAIRDADTRPETLPRRLVLASVRRPSPAVKPHGEPVRRVEERIPVTIVANPPAARVLVDGIFVGYGNVQDLLLLPGRHSVRLEHPTCAACRDTESVFVLDRDNPPRSPLRFSIGYKDATLTVTGVQGAEVIVAGVRRGRTQDALKIPMSGPEPVQVQVVVRQEGQPPRVQRVTLEAGKSHVLAL